VIRKVLTWRTRGTSLFGRFRVFFLERVPPSHAANDIVVIMAQPSWLTAGVAGDVPTVRSG
jgi:hypothetical protein